MPKESLVINGFQGGINKDADPTDIQSEDVSGKNELITCKDMLADMPGRIRGKYPANADGTSDGLSAGDAVDTAVTDLLIHGTDYYRERGVYKVGRDVEWVQKNKVRRPTKSALGTYTTPSDNLADGIGLNVDAAAVDAQYLFLGEDATVNSGYAMLGDVSSWAENDVSGRYITRLEESGLGSGKIDDDFFYGPGGGYFGTTGGSTTTGFKWAMVDANNSYADAPLNVVSGGIDIGTIVTQIRFTTLGNYTNDDRDTCVAFRVGNMEYTGNTDEPAGLYGIGANLQNLDINFDMLIHDYTSNINVGNWIGSTTQAFEKLVIGFSSKKDTANFNYDTGPSDYTRFFEITRAELDNTYKCVGARNRFSIPANSYTHNGSTFDITNFKAVYLVFTVGTNVDSGGASYLLDLWEVSFTGAADIGWHKQKPYFYETKIYDGVSDASEDVESLPSSYGIVDFSTSTAARLKAYRPTTAGYRGKIYYQLTDATGAKEDDKFLLLDVDYSKGIRKVGTDDWIDWGEDPGTSDIVAEASFSTTPFSRTFLSESGYKDRTEAVNANWLTATTSGRQAYIANLISLTDDIVMVSHSVDAATDPTTYPLLDTIGYNIYTDQTYYIKYIDSTNFQWKVHGGSYSGNVAIAARGAWQFLDGSTGSLVNYLKIWWPVGFATANDEWKYELKYDADRILKTSPGKRYGFSDRAYIDLELGGTAITHLDSASDRLFAFSNSRLTIVNIAQDFEFLEATYDGYGVDSSKQVCKIGEGLAWVNATGVYYFNGQGVESLSDEKMLSATFNPSGISYYGAEKLLLVWYNGSDLLSYSLKSKNWSSESLSVDQPNTTSIYYNNTPYWFDSSDALVKASLGSTSSASTIETGDISCGDLSRRKSFHKLYVTVKNGTELQLEYQIDADGSWSTPADFPNDNGINEFKLSAKGKTIRFRISTNGAADTNMEVSDLSLIYRNKSIK